MVLINFYGVPVHISEHALESVWVFPEDRFVEYEKKDEAWARKLGYGHEELRPGAYMVGTSLLVHPDVWAEIKRRMDVEIRSTVNDRLEAVSRRLESDAIRRFDESLFKDYPLSFASRGTELRPVSDLWDRSTYDFRFDARRLISFGSF